MGTNDDQHSCTDEGFRPGVGFLSEQEQAIRREAVLAYDYELFGNRPLSLGFDPYVGAGSGTSVHL